MVKSLMTARTESSTESTKLSNLDDDIQLTRLGIAAYVMIIGWIFAITVVGIYYATH